MDDDWFVAQVEQHGADIHAYLSRRTVMASPTTCSQTSGWG